MILTKACPKCHGDMAIEEDEYNDRHWKCFQCGGSVSLEEMEVIMTNQHEAVSTSPELPVPPKPEPATHKNMHRYYVKNREAILKDLAELGQRKTMERWGITTGSTIHNIKYNWVKQKTKEKAISKDDKPLSQDEPQKSPSDTKVTKVDKSDSIKTDMPHIPIPIITLELGNRSLIITDVDMLLLEDYDFERFWRYIGMIVRKRAK